MEECSRIGRVLVSLQYLSCQIKVTNWKLVEALSFPKTRASPKTETPTRTVWDWVVLITENPSPCLVLGKVAILYQTLRAEEDPFWLDSYYSCNSVSSHLCCHFVGTNSLGQTWRNVHYYYMLRLLCTKMPRWSKGLGSYSCLVQMNGCIPPSPLVVLSCTKMSSISSQSRCQIPELIHQLLQHLSSGIWRQSKDLWLLQITSGTALRLAIRDLKPQFSLRIQISHHLIFTQDS